MAPGAREFEDTAILHGWSDEYVTDVFQSYTMRGRRIAEAGRLDAELPTIGLSDPIFDLEWAFDTPSAMPESAAPAWVRSRAKYGNFSQLYERGDSYDLVAKASPLLAYPAGWTKTVAGLDFGRDRSRFEALARLDGIRAFRAKLDASPSEGAVLGFQLSGAAVLEIPRESNLDATVETVVAVAKAAGLPVRLRTDYAGETIRMKVTVNASMSIFGEPSAVGSDRLASFDVRKLVTRFGEQKVVEDLGVEDAEQLGALTSAEVLTTSNTSGRGFRFRLGPSEADDFTIPTADIKLADPTPMPGCARRTIEASLELLTATRSRGRYGDYNNDMPDLLEHAEECDGHEQWGKKTRRIARAQLEIYADMQRRLHQWEAAAASLRRACDFGAEESCEAAERADERAGRLKLPHVGELFTYGGALPESVLELGHGGLRGKKKRLATLPSLMPAEGEPKSVLGGIEKHGGPYWLRTHQGYDASVAMAVDAAIPTDAFKDRKRHV